MMNIDAYRFAGAFVLLVWPLLWLASLSTFRLALGPEVSAAWSRWRRMAVTVLLFGAGIYLVLKRLDEITPNGMSMQRMMEGSADIIENGLFRRPEYATASIPMLIAGGLLPVMLGTLAIKLYEKWVNERLSDAERRPGAEGVRAWLSGWNVLISLGILLGTWAVTDIPVWGVFAWMIVIGALLIYPMLATPALAMREDVTSVSGNLSAERERVLQMLESGKVTAEEAAELLGALGAAMPLGPVIEPWTPRRKMVLFGAVVVVIAFFLPWFTYNPGAELGRITEQMTPELQGVPGMPEMLGQTIHAMPQVHTETVRIAGGDVGKGLGWLCLALAVAAAAAPVVATGMTAYHRRLIVLAMLGTGVLILVYLCTSNMRFVSYGLLMAIVGYAVEIANSIPRRDVSGVRVAQAI